MKAVRSTAAAFRRFRATQADGQPATARLTLALLGVGWAAVLGALLLHALSPASAQRVALYPLLVSVVVLGLPHGALDHLVPARLGLAWGRRPLPVTLYLIGYAALAALYLGLWALAPRLAFVGFLLLTVLHWGQGDQRFLELFLGRRRPSRWGAWVTLFVRGALPVAVPVLAFPETAESLYRHAALGLGLPTSALGLSSAWVAGPLAAVLGAAFAAYAVNAVRAARGRAALVVDFAELGLLAALFAVLPAYLAVGIYFTLWHALRHLARLLLLYGAEDGRPGGSARRLWQLGTDLLPVTFAALALLAGFYLLNSSRVATLEGFVALYLVLVSALTLPHAVVVALMDRWQVGLGAASTPASTKWPVTVPAHRRRLR